MRTFNLVVALLFAFITTSYALPESVSILEARKGHRNGTTKANSVTHVCKQMAQLTKLTNLASNQTKLDAQVAKGKLNQTEVDAIKAKAAKATTELQTMQANATLVTTCQVVAAHEKVVGQCKTMAKLAKLSAMANNQTAIDALASKKGLNTTQVQKLQAKLANDTTKLKEMQSNTTLTSLCANQKSTSGDGTASSTGTAAAAAATGAAGRLAIQTIPVIVAVSAVFAVFL